MDEQVNQKDSKKLTAIYLAVVLSLGMIAVIAVIYFVEPEPIPEGSFFNPLPDDDNNQKIIADIDKTIAYIDSLPDVVEPEVEPIVEPVVDIKARIIMEKLLE